MGRGIIVFGASGSGITTIGKELAQQLNFHYFDLDDYFWRWDTEIPFTVPCPREERIDKLMSDLAKISGFVMSGSICGWDEPFIPLFDLAVFVTAPVNIRVERLHKRELIRFGERIQVAGDMYKEHKDFLEWARKYEMMEPPERCLKLHEQWAAALPCHLLRIDGASSVPENIEQITGRFSPKLPSDLAAILDEYCCEKDIIGQSSANVYRYYKDSNVFYLKIALANDEIEREYEKLTWLNGKLPVPKIKLWHEQDGLAYLLMTDAPGQLLIDYEKDELRKPYENSIKILADGLLMLQAIDINDCPFYYTLDMKLENVLRDVENDLVDMEWWDDVTDFESPMDLYHWLVANKPQEEICFVHDDYTPENIFIDGKTLTCLIDVGDCGLADKYRDIALCVRSIKIHLGDMEQDELNKYVDLLL